jgi:hypothetical protein
MRQDNYSTEYSARIVYCPSDDRNPDSGWYWEVRINGKLAYDPIDLERSRLTAEEMVLKYMAEALAVKEELAGLHE